MRLLEARKEALLKIKQEEEAKQRRAKAKKLLDNYMYEKELKQIDRESHFYD